MSREVRRSALVAVPIERMFEVIDRVEDYPAFLPWCVAAHDVERSETMVAATVEVGWKHLHFKVRTRNPKTPPTQMEIHLEDGSFRHFSGRWELKPLGERGCRVEFLLSYDLAIPGAATVAGAAIDHAADRMVDAFLERAEALPPAAGVAPDAASPTTPDEALAARARPAADLPDKTEDDSRAQPAPQHHERGDQARTDGAPLPASALPAPIPSVGGACQDAPPA